MKAIKSKVITAGKSSGPFSAIGLSKPAQRALAGKGISTIKQLSKFSSAEILKLQGIGKTAIPVLKRVLAVKKLSFRKESPKIKDSKTESAAVTAYLTALPEDARKTLDKVRQAILTAAPSAEEKISYKVPFYRYNGHLTAFLFNASHCSLVTMSRDVIRKFKEELKPYKISGTTIHFPHNKPLPGALIKEIIKVRLAENDAKSKLRDKTIRK